MPAATRCIVIFLVLLLSIPYFNYLAGSDAASGSSPNARIEGNRANETIGWNVSSAGDVNADGYDDLIVGAPGYNNSQGRAYVFFGYKGFKGDFNVSKANVTINGTSNKARFGWDVDGAGDVNADGFDDLIIGSPGEDAAYLVYGGPNLGKTDLSWMIFEDEFESGTLVGKGWVLQNGAIGGAPDLTAVASNKRNPDSTRGARLNGGDAGSGTDGVGTTGVGDPFISIAKDMSPYTKAVVYYYRGSFGGADFHETGENFRAEWTIDNWVTTYQLENTWMHGNLEIGASSVTTPVWNYRAYVLPAQAFNANFRVRFSSDGTEALEATYVDDVKIIAFNNGISRLNGDWNSSFGSSVAGAGDLDADGYDDVAIGAWNYTDARGDIGEVLIQYGNGTMHDYLTPLDPDAAIFESYTTNNAPLRVYDQNYSAQSFVPSYDTLLERIDLYYLTFSGVPGILNVSIETNNATGGDHPSGQKISSLEKTTVSSGTMAWYTLAFSSQPLLQGGTKYWIVCTSPTDITNRLNWGAAAPGTYSKGGWARDYDGYLNGIVWQQKESSAYDCCFRLNGSRVFGNLTMPGYAAGSQFGFSVDGAGDVNKDGLADLVVGAPGEDRAYIFYGPVERTWTKDGNADWSQGTFVHTENTTYMGGSLNLSTFNGKKGMAAYYEQASNTIPQISNWTGSNWDAEVDALTIGVVGNYYHAMASGTVRKNERVLVVSNANRNLEAQVFNGSKWDKSLAIATTLSNNAYRGFDVTYEPLSGDAVLVLSNATDNTKIHYCIWNGTDWSPIRDARPVGAGNIYWIVLAARPGSDEIMMVSLDSANDIYAQVWNGSDWGYGRNIETAASVNTMQCFDAVYEQASGKCLIAWGGGASTATMNYRRFSGGWSEAAGTLSAADAAVNWVKMAAENNSNYILCANMDNSATSDLDVQVWDGAAWGALVEVTADAEIATTPCFDVAWENHQTHEGLVAYGENIDTPRYRTVSGTTISGTEQTALDSNPGGGDPNIITLDPDPQTDDIMMVYVADDGGGAQDDIGAQLWGGSAWGYSTNLETTSNRDYEGFAYVFTDASGNYTSEVLETGTNSTWDRATWTEYHPTGTWVLFRIRASKDGSTWTPWTPWTANRADLSTGCGRYVQYQVFFNTTDVSTLPAIYDLALLYSSPSVILTGSRGEGFGFSVSGAGDNNADGFADVLVGAPTNSTSRGAAYLFNGKAWPSYTFLNATRQANNIYTGTVAGDRFGHSLASVTDTSGDKAWEVVIGAPNNGTKGAVYLFFGNSTVTRNLTAGSATGIWYGNVTGDAFGHSVTNVGNLDGGVWKDGILAGAPYWDNSTTGKKDIGRVYLYTSFRQLVPDYIIYISGDNQVRYAGTDLLAPIIFRVMNATGSPVSGARVNFSFLSVPASASAYMFSDNGSITFQDVSDGDGYVSCIMHLGNKTGNYRINVTGVNLTGKGGPKYNNTMNATAIVGLLAKITLTPYNVHPTAQKIPIGAPYLGYRAFGYDAYGNLNLTWSPVWGTTDAKGTAAGTGGTAATGYTAKYTAGMVLAFDNITVTDSKVITATNKSCINITYDSPDHLVYVSGDDQSVMVMKYLANELVFRVVNRTGVAVGGVQVNFSFQSVPPGAANYVFKESGKTWYVDISNATGIVNATPRLGTKTGNYVFNITGIGLTGLSGSIYNRTTNATAYPAPLSYIDLSPRYVYPASNAVFKGLVLTGYTAKAYDVYGNLNLTWTAVWGTTDSKGTVGNLGGSPLTGYAANYTAGLTVGYDNITVRDSLSITTNKSCINITAIPPSIDRIEIKPMYTSSSPLDVQAGKSITTYRAEAYNKGGGLNLTWTPVWGTTNGLGTPTATGGSALLGFTATYTAGSVLGMDNITVADSKSLASNSSAIKIIPDTLSYISLTPKFTYPAARGVKPGLELTGYVAIGRDKFGNRNLTWAATWGVSNALGTATDLGGSAAIGFMAKYAANTVLGSDNITVRDGTGTVANRSAVQIVPGNLTSIQLTPYYVHPSCTDVRAGSTINGYLAIGFDAQGHRNLTWAATWGSSAGKGTAQQTSGSAATGFIARYTANNGVGYDNITVRDASGLITNRSAIRVLPDTLARIVLTPMKAYPAYTEIKAGADSGQYLATGYDKYGNLNTTWTAVWGQFVGLGAIVNMGALSPGTFRAKFTAGGNLGYDNITVRDQTATTVTNRSCIRVVAGDWANIVKISGDGQSGMVGRELALALVVGVYDRFGNPVGAGAKVYFNITTTGLSGTGVLKSTATMKSVVLTGASGQAQDVLKLDTKVGTNRVKVELNQTLVVQFTSVGIADSIFRISISPPMANVTVDSKTVFTLQAWDKFQNPLTPTGTKWATDCGAIEVSQDTNCLFHALTTPKSGGYVQAVVGVVSNQSMVNVLAGELFRIIVTPNPSTIDCGAIQEFTATGKDVFNNTVPLTGTAWTSTAGVLLDTGNQNATLKSPASPVAGAKITATSQGINGWAIFEAVKISHNPYINGHVPDITMMEDDPPFILSLSLYEFDYEDSGDGLDWYMTGMNEQIFNISGAFSANDLLVITPKPNAYGDTLTTLWLKDTAGLTASQPLWINVTSVNDEPVFEPCPDLILHFSFPYQFDYSPYVYDLETPPEDLTLMITDTFVEADNNFVGTGLKVTYVYPSELLGKTIFVTLTVQDADGATDSQTITVTVTSDYAPELKSKLPDITLYEGQTVTDVFDLDDYFKDPDEDAMYFSYGQTHVNVTIHPDDHMVDVESLSNWYGKDTITFRAQDTFGALVEDTMHVTVLPINDPPIIAGVPDLWVHYDADYMFDLTPYVSDIDNESADLSLAFMDPITKQFDKHLWISEGNNLVAVINYPQSMLGMTMRVRIIVSDSLDFSFQDISITVTNDWPPEIVKPLPPVRFDEDTRADAEFNLNNFFTDVDKDLLFYSYGLKFIQAEIHSDGTMDFWAPKDWNGHEDVTIRATDPTGALVESRIRVNVWPINDAPVLVQLPDQVHLVGIWKIDLMGNLSDVDDPISALNITVKSADAKLIVYSNGLDLILVCDQSLKTTITINATDGHGGYTEIVVPVTVTKPAETTDNSTLIIFLFILLLILIILAVLIFFLVAYLGNYEVEAAYLIYHDGRLIMRLQGKHAKEMDEDIVSGMFTAVQDFINDTFADIGESKEGAGIKKLEFGGKNIMIERGKNIFLVLIVRGRPGTRLSQQMAHIVKDIESDYKDLQNWDGLMSRLKGVEKYLGRVIKDAQVHKERKKMDIIDIRK